jgi:bifunctional enzyme CysN/CysC
MNEVAYSEPLAEPSETIRQQGGPMSEKPNPAIKKELAALPHLPLKVLTCGSVDDGKSTLIGRLLWDATKLPQDQKALVEKHAITTADGKHYHDYSRLVDGLMAEREQGITIDIAFRYADLASRRLVLIDAPGHEQYTRNMVTGASQADMALILVDVRQGVTRQTRRHAAICKMAGIDHLVVVVNKMDLVQWDRAAFDKVADAMHNIASTLGFDNVDVIPVSALTGDNVTSRGTSTTPWYEGPTVLDELLHANPSKRLDASSEAQADRSQPARFPVQYVIRDGQDFRGLAGTVTEGQFAKGDRVHDVITGTESRIKQIITMSGELKKAVAGQAVTFVLEDDRDIARGSVLVVEPKSLPVVRRFKARLVWMHDTPYDASQPPLVRSMTDQSPVASLVLSSLTDLNTFEQTHSETLMMNDLAHVDITLSHPLALEKGEHRPALSRFILVDPLSGATLAAGVIDEISENTEDMADHVKERYYHTVHLTREDLRRDVFPDYDNKDEELSRRAKGIERLLKKKGVNVLLSLDSSEL